jgi:hypothetical protein
LRLQGSAEIAEGRGFWFGGRNIKVLNNCMLLRSASTAHSQRACKWVSSFPTSSLILPVIRAIGASFLRVTSHRPKASKTFIWRRMKYLEHKRKFAQAIV